ncbi:MAG: transglycosylase family protein [Actinomycetota bacterium]
MERLRFGERARRRARRSRLKSYLGIAGLVATLLGVPGANLGWELLSGADANTSRPDLSGVTTTEQASGMMRFRSNLFRNRPTPTPTPTEQPVEAATPVVVEAPPGSITEIIYAAAAEFGIDGGYLLSVAHCESNLNPSAVNPAGYHGLFQFGEETWAAFGYGSIYDPTAQARTAAEMLANGMASRWPNCA